MTGPDDPGADHPDADFWTRALWLAETTGQAAPASPLAWRKRTAALKLILEAHPAAAAAHPAAGGLRLDFALHALADAFGTLPAEADHVPATLLVAAKSRLADAHGSHDAALAAVTALCRAHANRRDDELTDADIRRGHVARRAAVNRAARRIGGRP